MSSATTSARIAPAAWARSIRRWKPSSVCAARLAHLGQLEGGAHALVEGAVLDVQGGALPDDVGERGPRVGRLDRDLDLAGQPAQALGHHGAEEVVLVGEGAVERADADSGALGQLGHRGVQPALGEELAGGGQDARAVALGVGAAGAGWSGGWPCRFGERTPRPGADAPGARSGTLFPYTTRNALSGYEMEAPHGHDDHLSLARRLLRRRQAP